MISRSTAWIATGSLGAAAIVGLTVASLSATPDQQIEQGTPVVIDTTVSPGSTSPIGTAPVVAPDGTAPAAPTTTTPGTAAVERPAVPVVEAPGTVQQVPPANPAPYDPSANSADSGD